MGHPLCYLFRQDQKPGPPAWTPTYNACTEATMGAVTADTHNRICTSCYDAAGNMTSYNGIAYTYDAENRLVSTQGATYTYDGDGNRVMKMTGATGTLYWRGIDGETANETDASNAILHRHVYFAGQRVSRTDNQPTWSAHFYLSDRLGSATVVTNQTAGIEEESDFAPFGQEKVITNSIPQNYKFTGKERDPESGLDNFDARYFASPVGRFMSPDWAARPTAVPYAAFGDPQSLNLYSYVRNDPVTNADADGHADGTADCKDSGGDQCKAKLAQEQQQGAQNKSWWQKLGGIFYAKGSVGVALEVGAEAHIGKAKSPLKVGAKVGADVKSTMTVTTEGTSVSATKEAQAGVNVGKVILGPQTSTENVTVKNGEALANPGVEKSSSAMFGTERAEGTLSKGDFGVGAEIDAGVLVVGIEVGVDFDKVKDLFNPH